MTLRKFALVMGLLTLLPSAVWAQTFRTGRPAYVFGEPISFVIAGVPADQNIDIYSHFQADGTPPPTGNSFGWQGGIQSGPNGIVKGRMNAPAGEEGAAGNYVLEARDPHSGIWLARSTVRVVPIAVTHQKGPYPSFSDALEVAATGFFSVQSLYVHYVYQPGGGQADKLIKTIRLGPIDPNTGGLSLTVQPFPFSPVPSGEYLIQFDGYQVYDDKRDEPPSAKRPYAVFAVRVQ